MKYIFTWNKKGLNNTGLKEGIILVVIQWAGKRCVYFCTESTCILQGLFIHMSIQLEAFREST